MRWTDTGNVLNLYVFVCMQSIASSHTNFIMPIGRQSFSRVRKRDGKKNAILYFICCIARARTQARDNLSQRIIVRGYENGDLAALYARLRCQRAARVSRKPCVLTSFVRPYAKALLKEYFAIEIVWQRLAHCTTYTVVCIRNNIYISSNQNPHT